MSIAFSRLIFAGPLVLWVALLGAASARAESGSTWAARNYGLSNYENDGWVPLKGPNTIYHCSGYGCRKMAIFSFSDRDIIELAMIMSEALIEATPAGERKAIANAVAWMERRVGKALGTDRDQASISFWAAGKKGQQDCVDEARNAAAYLSVLQANGLIRRHGGPRIVTRGNILSGMMPHYGVVIREKASRRVWAVDSGVGRNGALPRIEPARRWFARGGSRAPASLFR